MTSRANSKANALKATSQRLAEAAASDAGADPAAWLMRIQESVRDVYAELIDHRHGTETPRGLLHALTDAKPGLMAAEGRMEHEHADMLHRSVAIDVECERQIASDDYNVDIVRLQIRALHDIIILHVLDTTAMVYDAYFRDEGGES